MDGIHASTVLTNEERITCCICGLTKKGLFTFVVKMGEVIQTLCAECAEKVSRRRTT